MPISIGTPPTGFADKIAAARKASSESVPHHPLDVPFGIAEMGQLVSQLAGLTEPGSRVPISSPYDPFNDQSSIGMGSARNASSFQRQDRPLPILREIEGGWHSDVVNSLHKILRANARRSNDFFLSSENAFTHWLGNTLIDQPAMKIVENSLASYEVALWQVLTEAKAVGSDSLCRIINSQLDKVTALRDIPSLSLLNIWQFMLGHQQLHAAIVSFATDNPKINDALSTSSDIYKTLEDAAASLGTIFNTISDKIDKATVSFRLPDSVVPSPGASIREIAGKNGPERVVDLEISSMPRAKKPQTVVLGLHAGRMLMDAVRVPASLKSMLIKIGKTTEISDEWGKFNLQVMQALEDVGLSYEQATQVLNHNHLTITAQEMKEIQRAAMSSLQEIEFCDRLRLIYTGHKGDRTPELSAAIDTIKTLAGPQIRSAKPIAETPRELQTLCAALNMAVAHLFIKDLPPDMMLPIQKLIPDVPMQNYKNHTGTMELAHAVRGSGSQLLRPEYVETLTQTIDAISKHIATSSAGMDRTHHQLNDKVRLNRVSSLCEMLQESLAANHNRLADTERQR